MDVQHGSVNDSGGIYGIHRTTINIFKNQICSLYSLSHISRQALNLTITSFKLKEKQLWQIHDRDVWSKDAAEQDYLAGSLEAGSRECWCHRALGLCFDKGHFILITEKHTTVVRYHVPMKHVELTDHLGSKTSSSCTL